jgi:hypothetical protein
MAGGVIFHTWRGPGDTWPWPNDPSASILSANNKSRWLPFKDEQMQRLISSGSPRNSSGQQWENVHAGVKSAALSDNIGKM